MDYGILMVQKTLAAFFPVTKSCCNKYWTWKTWNILVSFRVCSHTSIAIHIVTFHIIMKPRKLAVPVSIKWYFFFPKHCYRKHHVCILVLCYETGSMSRTTCLNIFFGVALSPSEVFLMILLQSTDSLLHDVPGSESFNLELAWSFPFAAEFWNSSYRALHYNPH